MKRISQKATLIWSIRFMVVALIILFLSILLFSFSPMATDIIFILFVISAFIMLFIVFPLRYKKLSFSFDRKFIVLKYGIIFNYTSIMESRNIKYITVLSTPLCRVFGLKTVILKGAGARIAIPLVPNEMAKSINVLVASLK